MKIKYNVSSNPEILPDSIIPARTTLSGWQAGMAYL
jgi:hypothetical protein